jgi:serine/threonine protein kinase
MNRKNIFIKILIFIFIFTLFINKNYKYKIIKELGIGIQGTVYLVKDQYNDKYAMKIEKILKSHMDKIWREIDFSNSMRKIKSEHFMKIHDYWLDKNCNHKQSWNKIINKNNYNRILEKSDIESKSNYCSIKIYSFVELNLYELIKQNKINLDQYYDIFIQCLYIMYLCHQNGYLYIDWKFPNIGLVKTNNEYINIFGKNIKTHGYFVVLIDYGIILHKKYKLKNNQKIFFDNKINDLFFMFNRYEPNMILNFEDFENIKYDDDKINNYLPLIQNKHNDDILKPFIHKLIYDTEHKKSKLLIPLEAVKFMIKNIYDIKKCILFLINYK